MAPNTGCTKLCTLAEAQQQHVALTDLLSLLSLPLLGGQQSSGVQSCIPSVGCARAQGFYNTVPW